MKVCINKNWAMQEYMLINTIPLQRDKAILQFAAQGF